MSSPADIFKRQLEWIIASGVSEADATNTMLAVALIAKVKVGLTDDARSIIDENEDKLMSKLPAMLDPALQAVRTKLQ